MKKSAPSSDTTERLSQLMQRFMTLIHQRSAGDTLKLMGQAKLTMPQVVAMHMLAQRGPTTVSAIADCLRLTSGTTSHLVEQLVQGGFVARTEDAQDRRQRRIALAPAGRTLVERLSRARAREFAEVAERLSPSLQRQFEQVLHQMVTELSSSD